MENILFRDTIGQIAVERIECDYDFNMASKHFHNEYEIYYLLSGERYYFIEKKIHLVKRGSLVLIDRNQVHRTVASNNNYHDRIKILIPSKEISSLLKLSKNIQVKSFFKNHSGIINLNEVGRKYVENILFFIIREMKMKHSNYEFVVKMKLVELLVYAIRCKNGESPALANIPIKTEKHKKINEIAEYISLNSHQKMSLADIAESFFISKCYLSRIFKEVTGFTVNEYINVIRIKRARKLLEMPEYNITEIADLVGYESITYFEKVFKKYHEISPLKYRKNHIRKMS